MSPQDAPLDRPGVDVRRDEQLEDNTRCPCCGAEGVAYQLVSWSDPRCRACWGGYLEVGQEINDEQKAELLTLREAQQALLVERDQAKAERDDLKREIAHIGYVMDGVEAALDGKESDFQASFPIVLRVAGMKLGHDALSSALTQTKAALARAQARCVKGHEWSNQFGEDWSPEKGTPCDCGLRRFGFPAKVEAAVAMAEWTDLQFREVALQIGRITQQAPQFWVNALCELATVARAQPSPEKGWQPIETNKQDGAPFLAFAESLIDLDFNPHGVVEACFDGDGFIGAVWDGQHDVWQTRLIVPTHWKPFPLPPVGELPPPSAPSTETDR